MRNQWVHTSAFINMEFNNRNLFQITPDTRPLPPLSCVLSISLDGLKSSTFTTSAPYILTVAPVSFSNTHIPFPYIATYSLLTSLTMSSLNLTVYTDSCLTSSDSLHVTTANKKSGIIVDHCPLPLCENLEPKMEFSLPNSKSAIKINFGLKKIIKKIE